MTTVVISVELKVSTDCKDLGKIREEIDRVKTKSGNEIPVTVIRVQRIQAEPVSNEPGCHKVTREASSAPNFQTTPSLQSAAYQLRSIDIHGGSSLIECTEDTSIVSSDGSKVTTCHQPVKECDAQYFSANPTSLHNKGDEQIDLKGLFCEVQSRNIDDYNDYSTKITEEGLQTTIYIPESPQPIMLEDSPLVIQDNPCEVITISFSTSTTTHSSYAVCCSEVAANSVSEMVVVADDGQIPAKPFPRDTDDCSDHSTNEPQEESFYNCLETIVPNYRMPQMPPTFWHNKNPLAMPNDFSPAITISASTNTIDDSFPVNAICCSEVVITATSQMVVAGLATNAQ